MGRRPSPETIRVKRTRPLYGKSLVEQIREEQRRFLDAALYGIGITRDGRRVDPFDFFAQENDPMQININIREIANGVLLTAHSNGPFSVHTAPEFHYSDPATAFAAAERHMLEAWGEAAEHRLTKDNPLGYSKAEREALRRETEEIPADPPMPVPPKLPEEAAADQIEKPAPEYNGFNQDVDTSGYADSDDDEASATYTKGLDDCGAEMAPEARFLHNEPAVGVRASAGEKIIEGLQDAVDYAQGDESKGVAHHTHVGEQRDDGDDSPE